MRYLNTVIEKHFPNVQGIRTDGKQITEWPSGVGAKPSSAQLRAWHDVVSTEEQAKESVGESAKESLSFTFGDDNIYRGIYRIVLLLVQDYGGTNPELLSIKDKMPSKT